MAADIKTYANPVKQSYVTGSSIYKQAFVGHSSPAEAATAKTPTIQAIGVNARVNSALVTEQDVNSYMRVNRDQSGVQVSFTKFRPVTSHPTSSLLASLYKQHTFAESRNSQAAAKLPNILHQSRPSTRDAKRRRELKSFTYPTYSSMPHASLPAAERVPPHPHTALGSRKAGQQQHSSYVRSVSASSAAVNASATWTAVHDSILANGHGLLPESQSTNALYSNFNSHLLDSTKPPINRTSVNYMPFYEIRGRGDGASVVDMPSIDVEGKKIQKHRHSDGKQKEIEQQLYHRSEDKKQEVDFDKSKHEEINMSRKSDEQSSLRATESNEEPVDSPLVSSISRHKNRDYDISPALKVEKKVRFSGSVTTNKFSDEPSYTEALIESLHSAFKQKNYLNTTTHRADHNSTYELRDSRRELSVRSALGTNESLDASSSARGEDEDPMFVTPVMKVVVTKRQAPTGAEEPDSGKSSPRDARSLATSQHRVTTMASRLLNNHTTSGTQAQSTAKPNTTADILRRGTQATQRASTAGYARNKEAIARVVKLVPKRQTVVMPNFSKQPAWPCRNFPQHPKNPKLTNMVSGNPSFSASVQGSSFVRSNMLNSKIQNNPENLRSRLTSAGGGIYLTTSQGLNRKSAAPPPDPLRASEGDTTKTSFMPRTSAEDSAGISRTSTAAREAVPSHVFMDFQPIPSMPDHINFCDPRKTELILRWLDDVNKKRNIESRLRRVTSSRSHT